MLASRCARTRASAGSPGFGVSGEPARGAGFEVREHARRQRAARAAAVDRGERVGVTGGIRAERPRPDHVEAIARHVAHHQQLDALRARALRQAAARERAQVLAHRVELLDVGAGGEQRLRRLRQLLER